MNSKVYLFFNFNHGYDTKLVILIICLNNNSLNWRLFLGTLIPCINLICLMFKKLE